VRDQAAFDAGHAPGAVRVPLDEWDAAAKAADTGFVKTAYWDKALSALGVDPTVTAVAFATMPANGRNDRTQRFDGGPANGRSHGHVEVKGQV
jgi:3-mercaptopyruvate sulfurtransferase SseA